MRPWRPGLGCALGGVLLLGGCRTDCATFEETVILDPDGVLDEYGIEQLYGAKDAFAAAVAVDGVCVSRVYVRASLQREGLPIGGFYSPDDQQIGVSAEYDWDLGRILTHELCHALDDQLSLSDAHPELFSDAWGDDGLNETLYSDTELRESERFAQLCELGPHQPALTTALEQLGQAPAGDLLLRDWVYPRFEDVPVGIGPALEFGEPATLALTGKRERVHTWAATGDHLVVYVDGEHPVGDRLVEIDPTGPAVRAEARLPRRLGRTSFLTGIGDTDPILQTGWNSPAPRLYRWNGGAPAPLTGPFAALAGDADTSFTVDGDRAWWQTWGDGLPVQTGLLSTGETGPYEPSGEHALVPPLVRLPEGPASFAYQAWPPWQEWFVFGEADLPPLTLPNGVRLIGTLADGTVAGWMSWEPDDGSWCIAPVLRNPEGVWWLPADLRCDTLSAYVIDGALYGIVVDDDVLQVTPIRGW